MSTPIDYDAMPHTGYRDCCPRCAEDAFEDAERAFEALPKCDECGAWDGMEFTEDGNSLLCPHHMDEYTSRMGELDYLRRGIG